MLSINLLLFQGVLLGLSNTAGVLAGVLGTAATGYILQHGNGQLLDIAFKICGNCLPGFMVQSGAWQDLGMMCSRSRLGYIW